MLPSGTVAVGGPGWVLSGARCSASRSKRSRRGRVAVHLPVAGPQQQPQADTQVQQELRVHR
jgi:hypothetical protein